MIIYVRSVGMMSDLEKGTCVMPIEVPEGSSVLQTIERLGMKWDEVGFFIVNGEFRDKTATLKNNDYLTLVALLTGG